LQSCQDRFIKVFIGVAFDQLPIGQVEAEFPQIDQFPGIKLGLKDLLIKYGRSFC